MDTKDEKNSDSLSEILNNKEKSKVSIDDVLFTIDKKKQSPSMQSEARQTVPEDGVNNSEQLVRFQQKPVDTERREATKKRVEQRRRRDAKIKLKKQKQSKKTAFQITVGAVLSVIVLSVSVYFGMNVLSAALDFIGLVSNDFDIEVIIPEEPSIDDVTQVLEENGIITQPKIFKFYSSLSEADDDYVGGSFTLSSSMGYSTIIRTLQTSKYELRTVQVRIIEGMTASQIGALLEENSVCLAKDFEQYYREKMNRYDFEKRVLQNNLKFNQLEGYLFPDTYDFYINNDLFDDPDAQVDTSEDARVAAERIYSNFNSKITREMYKTMNEKGLTLDELITLASMVQAEAATAEDMENVASVFLNRLAHSDEYPQLQSDVTVFYVQNEIEPFYPSSGLSTSLSRISNAYDTYVVNGIPAGAVCNPGMDAINAVLYAPDTNYYYFCANEETLETFFAENLEQHEQNLILAGLA